MDPLAYDYTGRDNAGGAAVLAGNPQELSAFKYYDASQKPKKDPLADSLARQLMSMPRETVHPHDAAAIKGMSDELLNYNAKLVQSGINLAQHPELYAQSQQMKRDIHDAAIKAQKDANYYQTFQNEVRKDPFKYSPDEAKKVEDWYNTPIGSRSQPPTVTPYGHFDDLKYARSITGNVGKVTQSRENINGKTVITNKVELDPAKVDAAYNQWHQMNENSATPDENYMTVHAKGIDALRNAYASQGVDFDKMPDDQKGQLLDTWMKSWFTENAKRLLPTSLPRNTVIGAPSKGGTMIFGGGQNKDGVSYATSATTMPNPGEMASSKNLFTAIQMTPDVQKRLYSNGKTWDTTAGPIEGTLVGFKWNPKDGKAYAVVDTKAVTENDITMKPQKDLKASWVLVPLAGANATKVAGAGILLPGEIDNQLLNGHGNTFIDGEEGKVITNDMVKTGSRTVAPVHQSKPNLDSFKQFKRKMG